MDSRTRCAFFASCARGLEALLHDEVRALKLARSERQVGGVFFEGTLEDAWRANLELRTATRILLRLARFEARDADELHAGATQVPWEELVSSEGKLWIAAQTSESRLDHSQFIAQRVKDALVDRSRMRTGNRPSVDRDDPDLRLHAHVFRDRVTLSLDTSGEPLFKRGWRVHQGPAPLAETLAAAVVKFSGWDARAPLLDPFSGSGTLVIEAGLIAGGTAPGRFRSFAFERLPGHDAARYALLCESVRARARTTKWPILRGSDVDPRRVDEARENAARAELGERAEFLVGDAREFAPRSGWNAWIVTNPPYGQRLGGARALSEVYRELGALLRERAKGCRLALLCGDRRLGDALGLSGVRRIALENGGLACELLLAEL